MSRQKRSTGKALAFSSSDSEDESDQDSDDADPCPDALDDADDFFDEGDKCNDRSRRTIYACDKCNRMMCPPCFRKIDSHRSLEHIKGILHIP